MPKKGAENIGMTYTFHYKSGALEISDGQDFKATLEVDPKKKFFPWLELYMKSVVLVQGKTKKIVVPEPASAPKGGVAPEAEKDMMKIEPEKKKKKEDTQPASATVRVVRESQSAKFEKQPDPLSAKFEKDAGTETEENKE